LAELAVRFIWNLGIKNGIYMRFGIDMGERERDIYIYRILNIYIYADNNPKRQ
jgi:hypothetical protein